MHMLIWVFFCYSVVHLLMHFIHLTRIEQYKSIRTHEKKPFQLTVETFLFIFSMQQVLLSILTIYVHIYTKHGFDSSVFFCCSRFFWLFCSFGRLIWFVFFSLIHSLRSMSMKPGSLFFFFASLSFNELMGVRYSGRPFADLMNFIVLVLFFWWFYC